MRTLLLQTLACCAVLFPYSRIEAKTYGGFKPGDTFNLKLSYRTCVKVVGPDVVDKQPIPAGIPNFKVGGAVKFTIGKKGQLTAKGMSLPFNGIDKLIHSGDVLYLGPPHNGYPFGDTGRIARSAAGKPVKLDLDFAKTEISGGVTTTWHVYYAFVK